MFGLVRHFPFPCGTTDRTRWRLGARRTLIRWFASDPRRGGYPSRVAVIKTVSKFMTNEPP